jgi:hypothetical protein
MQARNRLTLVVAVLGGESYHIGAGTSELGVVVAESARFRRTSPGTRDEVPVLDKRRLAGTTGSRIGVHDPPQVRADVTDDHVSAAGRGQRNRRHLRAWQVARPAVVGRHRQSRRQHHWIVSAHRGASITGHRIGAYGHYRLALMLGTRRTSVCGNANTPTHPRASPANQGV